MLRERKTRGRSEWQQVASSDRVTFTIGDLAKRSGVNIDTILYYERRGLLAKPDRTPSGYRVFSADSVQVLRFIKRAQRLDFSLREIKELLVLRGNPDATCADVGERAEAKLAEIDTKLRALRKTRAQLQRLASACTKDATTQDCPVLKSLDGSGAG